MEKIPNLGGVSEISWKTHLDPQTLKITQVIQFKSL
jgi:hypothetical protein